MQLTNAELVSNPVIIRTGRVTLSGKRGTLPKPESFLVQQWSDGAAYYYLGRDLARTSDGWVALTVPLEEVVWDRSAELAK